MRINPVVIFISLSCTKHQMGNSPVSWGQQSALLNSDYALPEADRVQLLGRQFYELLKLSQLKFRLFWLCLIYWQLICRCRRDYHGLSAIFWRTPLSNNTFSGLDGAYICRVSSLFQQEKSGGSPAAIVVLRFCWLGLFWVTDGYYLALVFHLYRWWFQTLKFGRLCPHSIL